MQLIDAAIDLCGQRGSPLLVPSLVRVLNLTAHSARVAKILAEDFPATIVRPVLHQRLLEQPRKDNSLVGALRCLVLLEGGNAEDARIVLQVLQTATKSTRDPDGKTVQGVCSEDCVVHLVGQACLALTQFAQRGLVSTAAAAALETLLEQAIERAQFMCSVLDEFNSIAEAHGMVPTPSGSEKLILCAQLAGCCRAANQTVLYLASVTFPPTVSIEPIVQAITSGNMDVQVSCHTSFAMSGQRNN